MHVMIKNHVSVVKQQKKDYELRLLIKLIFRFEHVIYIHSQYI